MTRLSSSDADGDGDGDAGSSGEASSAEIGGRLRDVREQRGLTLREVADASEDAFQVATLSAWERGERRIGLVPLMWLADHYGVPVGALLGSRREDGGRQVVTVDRDRLAAAAPYWEPLKSLVDRTVRARHQDPGPQVRLRGEDVEFIAAVLDLSVPALVDRLAASSIATPVQPTS